MSVRNSPRQKGGDFSRGKQQRCYGFGENADIDRLLRSLGAERVTQCQRAVFPSPPTANHEVDQSPLQHKIASFLSSPPRFDELASSQIPPSLWRRYSLSGKIRGERDSARDEAIALGKIYDHLVKSTHEVDEAATRKVSSDAVLMSEKELIATDVIFAEIIRQVATHCVERGALLQLVREVLVNACRERGLTQRSDTFASHGSAGLPASSNRRETEGVLRTKLENCASELASLRDECQRLRRLNSLLSAQRTHDSVLQRSISLVASGSGQIDRASVLNTASQTALTLKRVKCETKGEVDGVLRLHDRDQKISVGVQTPLE